MKIAFCSTADLGLIRVAIAESFMSNLCDLRSCGLMDDTLLFLRHPKTVAVGLKDRVPETSKDLLVPSERLAAEGIELVRSTRGGGITFHWPGQLICYPIIALEPHERDIPAYMRKLEEVGMAALRSFGVYAERRRDTPAHVGLWLDKRKIMSMGVRVTKWVTSFGFAINVSGDFHQSRYVQPCGIQDAELTTLEVVLGRAPSHYEIMKTVIHHFSRLFQRDITAYQSPHMRSLLENTTGRSPREMSWPSQWNRV